MDGVISLIKGMPSNLPGWAYIAIVAIICICILLIIKAMGNNTKTVKKYSNISQSGSNNIQQIGENNNIKEP